MSENPLGWAAGIGVLLAMVVEIAPIKINPLSWVLQWIGRAINSEVLGEVKDIRRAQTDTRKVLDEHIRVDDERNADLHRTRILQFNKELLRNLPHTREDFIEVLAEIDHYDRYCREHPDYENHRAVRAIANIERVYDKRLQKHDFYGETPQ